MKNKVTKSEQRKGNARLSAGLAGIITTTLLGTVSVAPIMAGIASRSALADQGGGDPFANGTEKVRLSSEEKASLLRYADNSNTKLQKALDQAKGKGFAEANAIYLGTIRQVVIESDQEKPRSELLMRMALNQALELTFGVPTSDGKGIAQSGLLKDISNQALLTVILEDSIRLAQSYYQDDRTAIQKGTLLDLPYVKLAAQRLELARQWMASVFEPTSLYQLEVAAIQQFLNTAANCEQQHRAFYAEELTHADDLVGEYPAQAPQDVKNLMEDIRELRGEVRKLEASVAAKLQAEGQNVPAGSDGASSGGTNQLAQAFVAIQPGTFVMGSPSGESGRVGDEKQHQVTISHSFEIQTTDVTQLQWVKVMGSNPSFFAISQDCPKTFTQVNGVSMCPNNPVESVSWDDVQGYLTQLNQQSHDGYMYRLPTEAEWEYAARAGTTTPYYFGGDGNLNANAWYSSNSGGHTHEVAQLHPNAFGLYDMAGNVWQWVQDGYASYPAVSVTDPVQASGSYRVIRGGDWADDARLCRSANRNGGDAGFRDGGRGFRLVRTR